jgi:hypothetical protein
VLCTGVIGLQRIWIHTVVEQKEGLEVGGTGFGWECCCVFGFSGVAFTEPFYSSEGFDICLGFCGCVSNDGFVVLGDGYLGVFDGDVIS